jgi:hypothetical protein
MMKKVEGAQDTSVSIFDMEGGKLVNPHENSPI